MFIFTVYLPEIHVDYLEEWIRYHLSIGITHFYLYDNGSSTGYGNKNTQISIYDSHGDSSKKLTRYGFSIKYTVEEARDRESQFLKKYPVTKVFWQPVVDNKVVYAYNQAVLDFTTNVKSGLCAFIDLDEYIVKREEFTPCRMSQRIYKDFHFYKSVFDCREMVSGINLDGYNTKCILDLSKPITLDDPSKYVNSMHFYETKLPKSKNFFNHYNFNKVHYKMLKKRKDSYNLQWSADSYNNCCVEVNDPFAESTVPINLEHIRNHDRDC